MTYQAKNNAFSTLAGPLTNVATTLSVQAGHGDRFPIIAAPGYTMVTLEDNSGNREIVKVTARASASGSMTIVRAQEGTTARSWSAGDSVELRMTAGETQTLFDHVDKDTGAHAASAISYTPSGNLAATTVQDALNELDSEKASLQQADVANNTNAAASKATPVDADLVPLIDSSATFSLKKLTWANIKATLKTYFDTLYLPLGTIVGVTDGDKGDITVSASGATWTLDNDAVTTAKIQNDAVTTAKIQNDAVTFAKMQNISTSKLLGRATASSGDVEELGIGSGLSLSGTNLTATIASGISVAASGTAVDFTGIPSWVKRITVPVSGLSLSGFSQIMVQLGSTTFTTTGYLGSGNYLTNGGVGTIFTSGISLGTGSVGSSKAHGILTLVNLTGNTWLGTFVGAGSDAGKLLFGAGAITLSATLDRIRITTVNGTDTFDAGTINVMYE